MYYHEESFGMFMDIRAKCLAAAATLPPEPVESPEGGEEGEGGEGEPAAEGEGAEGDSGEGEAGDAEGDAEPAPEELPFDGWDGSVSQVEESIVKLEEAIRRKADLDAAKEAEGGGEDAEVTDAPAEGEEAPEGGDEPPPVDEVDAGPPPEDVLDAARAEFAEAMRVASLPQSRADLLAAALSEAVSNRLADVDETYETARAKYRPATPPPPPPKLDEDGNPIEEENPPAEDEPAPAGEGSGRERFAVETEVPQGAGPVHRRDAGPRRGGVRARCGGGGGGGGEHGADTARAGHARHRREARDVGRGGG